MRYSRNLEFHKSLSRKVIEAGEIELDRHIMLKGNMLNKWPSHPVTYEINPRVWLGELSRRYQKPITLYHRKTTRDEDRP